MFELVNDLLKLGFIVLELVLESMSKLFFPSLIKNIVFILKPLQNKKGQKNLGYWEKNSHFSYKRTAYFSGTPNFFGPSYFEAALAVSSWLQSTLRSALQDLQGNYCSFYPNSTQGRKRQRLVLTLILILLIHKIT